MRIRNIATRVGEIQHHAVREVSEQMIRDGAIVELPQEDGSDPSKFTVKIRPVSDLKPAFEQAVDQGGELQVYSCIGNWVLGSTSLGESFTARTRSENFFRIQKAGGRYQIRFLIDGTHVISEDHQVASSGQSIELSRDELLATTFRNGSLSWRFSAFNAPALSESTTVRLDPESVWFKKSLRYAAIAFAAFLAATLLWPKPEKKEEELVPPQFAQIVMKKQPSKASAAPAESGPSGGKQAVRKAQDTAVVQAFRAQALQNAVSGLLKGGMTRLLAQSDLVSGHSGEAKNLFNQKSKALQATAPNTGAGADPNVKVAALGGEGNGAGGKGVGYRKGGNAKVAGQGQSLIDMDTFGSTVDEGLTKDEVGEVIHRHLSEVRYCYESAMLRTPDIEGKLMVAFTIGGNGSVKTASAKSSTLPDPRLDDCIIRRLMSWKFPNPRGGVDVSVTYPFIFKTLGR